MALIGGPSELLRTANAVHIYTQYVYGPLAKLELPLFFGWSERRRRLATACRSPVEESFLPKKESSSSTGSRHARSHRRQRR
jgi:hypothetical protein